MTEQQVIQELIDKSYVLDNTIPIEALLERIGDARIVMLGEASHGTHEYYTWRTHITQRLIQEKGFNFIAVEGDWPDCYKLNRFVKGYDQQHNNAAEVLRTFRRWPTWLWANWETAALMEWLRQHNSSQPADELVGFYGLDMYSLWESVDAIMHYLQRVDPAAFELAREAFVCFEPYRKEEGKGYARASRWVPELCENEVVNLLREIRRKMPQYEGDHEMPFSTEQNALIAVNAEKYYRAMVKGDAQSWNIRDRHMADTLERLLHFHSADSKAIIWAHNTHIGDARATDMTLNGMYNMGELVRGHFADDEVVLVGFGSHSGTVTASSYWGAPMQTMQVPEALEGSWEHLLHEAGAQNRLLIMDELTNEAFLEDAIGHRAIGVVYHPAYEQYGNFVPSILPMRYDAFIYLDKTTALHPLDVEVDKELVPDTWPFGM